MPKFQTPTGMHDILVEDWEYFQKIEKKAKEIVEFYGFKRIETPILEEARLFEKGTGASTDIVQKEMFSFRTRGGDYLTLRPEYTPSVVRAYIQHGMQSLPKPVKLWYFGPCFRYERPQAGRYRQFHQLGVESLGTADAIVDAQVVFIFYTILKELGFKNLVVEINSIGDSQCRPYYKKTLVGYLRSQRSALCADCRRRISENPLRVLDCKEEKCQRIVRGAPQILDHLCKECSNHFKSVLEFLDELEVPYQLNPYLVRGLDYYTKTVFEIFSEEDKERQSALCGGGRYDNLVKLLGGKETPACGGGCGAERVINLMKEIGLEGSKEKGAPLVFLAQVGEAARRKALRLFEELRKNNIKTTESFHKTSLSSQLQLANKLNVRYTLILGEKEAIEDEIIIREMNSGRQEIVPLAEAVKILKRKVKELTSKSTSKRPTARRKRVKK